MRVYNDATGFAPLWFELEPGRFYFGENKESARRIRGDAISSTKGYTLEMLEDIYGDFGGKLVVTE